MEHVGIVLEILEVGRMTVNLAKSVFCQKSVDFLGHILSTEGLSTNPKKLKAIANWPKQKNQHQLRVSLGFVPLTEYIHLNMPVQQFRFKNYSKKKISGSGNKNIRQHLTK